VLAPLGQPVAEVRLDSIRTEAPVVLESAALVDADQAVSQVPESDLSFGPVNVSSLLNNESSIRGSGAIESLVVNAVDAAVGGATLAPIVLQDGNFLSTFSALLSALDSSVTIAGPRAGEPIGFSEITATLVDGAINAVDLRFGGQGMPMSPPAELDEPMGLAPWRGALAANPDDKTTDMSLSGPVLWTETDTGLLTWMSLTQAAGRSSGRGSSPIFAELALQMNPNGEAGSSSGLLYLATGGWTSVVDELSVLREAEVLPVDQGTTEPDMTVSTPVAGIPLSMLLSGTDVAIPTEQGNLEQIAELIPLSESSLALAATLWTVRSNSQASAPGLELATGAADPALSSPSPTYWAVFMTGVDRAFEQTFRDVQADTPAGGGRHKNGEEPQRGLDNRLEWHGPILPGAGEGLRGGKHRSTRPGRSSATDDSNDADPRMSGPPGVSHLSDNEQGDETTKELEVAQPQDLDVQPVVLASTPVLWVVSVSSIVAGWFWGKKRERQQHLGPGKSQRSNY